MIANELAEMTSSYAGRRSMSEKGLGRTIQIKSRLVTNYRQHLSAHGNPTFRLPGRRARQWAADGPHFSGLQQALLDFASLGSVKNIFPHLANHDYGSLQQ
jgi:hypothetical protein